MGHCPPKSDRARTPMVVVLVCDGFTLWQYESPKWYDILSDLRLSVGSTISSRESRGKGLKPLGLSTVHRSSMLTRQSSFTSLATPDNNLCTVGEGEDTFVSTCRLILYEKQFSQLPRSFASKRVFQLFTKLP